MWLFIHMYLTFGSIKVIRSFFFNQSKEQQKVGSIKVYRSFCFNQSKEQQKFGSIKVNRTFLFDQSKGQQKSVIDLFHFCFLFTFLFIMEMEILGQQSSISIGALILGRQWCTLMRCTLHNHVWARHSVEKNI